MAKQNNLRNRKKSSTQKNKAPDKTKSEEAATPEPAETDEAQETLRDTFTKHPLVRVAPFVLVPYLIYQTIYFLTLKHPEVINNVSLGFMKLRPAMKVTDQRQLLVLGAEVAENRFVTGGLGKVLNLEVVHEAFNTEENTTMDTVVRYKLFCPAPERQPFTIFIGCLLLSITGYSLYGRICYI